MQKINNVTHEVNAVHPRLSDEDPDPMEREDSREGHISIVLIEGWLPWTPEDINDVRKIISRLEPKQQFILESFLDGLSFTDLSVTEKYWRYHFAKGLENIKRELGL